VAPALRLLRRLNNLDEGEAGTKLSEGAYPVGPVEDEVPILVRGDYYGVVLLTFGFDSFPQTDQAVFIVGFVEDKAPEVNKEEVFEGGDHVAGVWRDETAGTLGVSPAAAPQEVEQDETAEEEGRDDDEESYDANKKIDCVQSSPFNGSGLTARSTHKQSGRPDLNRRPLGPQPSALPDCATSRRVCD
jgi:hypothetical protein